MIINMVGGGDGQDQVTVGSRGPFTTSGPPWAFVMPEASGTYVTETATSVDIISIRERQPDGSVGNYRPNIIRIDTASGGTLTSNWIVVSKTLAITTKGTLTMPAGSYQFVYKSDSDSGGSMTPGYLGEGHWKGKALCQRLPTSVSPSWNLSDAFEATVELVCDGTDITGVMTLDEETVITGNDSYLSSDIYRLTVIPVNMKKI